MTAPISWAAEEAAINGFPALRQIVFDGWLLRFSGGTRRTPNSATPLQESQGDLDGLIATCEALYRAQGRSAIIRIPSIISPQIDRLLAARGYAEEGESCAIAGAFEPIIEAAGRFGGIDGVTLSPRATPEWLAALARLQGQSPEQQQVYRGVLTSILLPAAFAALTVDGAAAALAYGVVHRGLLCYESVVTDPQHRRQGLSRRVLAALAVWAKANGATTATLQVEANNAPARTLYNGIGMTTELHRYHYRRQPS